MRFFVYLVCRGRVYVLGPGTPVEHGRPVPGVPVRRGTRSYTTPRRGDPHHRRPHRAPNTVRGEGHYVHHTQGLYGGIMYTTLDVCMGALCILHLWSVRGH